MRLDWLRRHGRQDSPTEVDQGPAEETRAAIECARSARQEAERTADTIIRNLPSGNWIQDMAQGAYRRPVRPRGKHERI